MTMDDLHGYAKRVESYLRKLKGGNLTERNKELVEKFVNDCYSDGISHGRVYKYLWHLLKVENLLNKDFDQANSDELKAALRTIELCPAYSENTKRDYRIALKKFYKWIGNGTVPEPAKWIKTGAKLSKKLLPEDVLSENDIRDLVKAADNPRDKAFIFVLYESGCRIGEILGIKLKNVLFDKYGAQIVVNGKTGARRVRIIFACDYLRCWCENHPNREEPESYLWVTLSTNNRGKRMGYQYLHYKLREIAKKAGVKRKVNFHNFRHARATHLADKLTEVQLCEIFGWTLSSKMPSTYVHLSGRNLDNSLLKLAGIIREDEEDRTVCPRCKQSNDRISRYCNKCGLPFGLEIVMKAEQNREDADERMNKLMEDKGIQKAIREALLKINVEKAN